MHIRPRLLTVLTLLSLTAPALTHDDVTVPDPAAPADGSAAQDTPEQIMVKTQFKALRFQEDWSGMEPDNAVSDHWFPEIKWIELAEGWHLNLGGQVRWMEKDEINRNLLGTFPDHNEFSLLKMRLFGDLHIEDDARFFVEVIGASIHGNNPPTGPPPAANDRDNWDLLNLFVDLLATPELTLRGGRFQMLYGLQRLIGLGDWANVNRSFQGGMIQTKVGNVSTDVFVTNPVNIVPRNHDDTNLSRYFSGVYSTWKLDDTRNVDGYFLALNDDEDGAVSGAGNPDGLDVYTLGGRYAGKAAPFDWDGEVAVQRGRWSSDDVRAWMWSVAAGYTMADLPGVPRVALDLDTASGDDNPTDSEHGNFNQLFPSTHPFFGYMDLVGRSNIVSFIPNIRWKLGDTAWFRAAWADFNLQNDSDALYNSSGTATLADPTGGSGNHVGHEWDFSLGWAPSFLAPHNEFLFGYSYFNPGNFVENLGAGDRPQLLYVQYTFTF